MSAAAYTRASAVTPWSSRARDSGPNTGHGSHQRRTWTSRPPVSTRPLPAEAPAGPPGSSGSSSSSVGSFSMIAFGGQIAPDAVSAIT